MRPKASNHFLQNDQDFLWFSLTCRESGIAASVRLNIEDEVMALDLDNAVSLRLLQFDTERMRQSARLIAYEVSKLFGDGSEDEGEVGVDKYDSKNAKIV